MPPVPLPPLLKVTALQLFFSRSCFSSKKQHHLCPRFFIAISPFLWVVGLLNMASQGPVFFSFFIFFGTNMISIFFFCLLVILFVANKMTSIVLHIFSFTKYPNPSSSTNQKVYICFFFFYKLRSIW